MHHKTRRALDEFNWTAQALKAAYVRDGEVRIRVRRRVVEQAKYPMECDRTRHVNFETEEGNHSLQAIQLTTSDDQDSEEHTIQLPTASSNLPFWTVPAIGVCGFGKTFFYAQGQETARGLMIESYENLKQKTRYGQKRTTQIEMLADEKAQLRQLVQDLTNQLQALGQQLVAIREERDLFKSERMKFMEERDAALTELMKLRNESSVIRGPWRVKRKTK